LNNFNNELIADYIIEKLHWFANRVIVTSIGTTFKTHYYYKLSNENKQTDSFKTICDSLVDSLEDFYNVIERIEKNSNNNLQEVKEQSVIAVKDYNKPLYILVKSREE
jgi:Na+/phosphate symporter